MTDSRPAASASSNWIAAQRRYGELWTDLLRETIKGATSTEVPGESGSAAFERWWTAIAKSIQPATCELFQEVIQQSRPFYQLADLITKSLADAEVAAARADADSENLGSHMDKILEVFTDLRRAGSHAASNVSALGQVPLREWQDLLSSVCGLGSEDQLKTIHKMVEAIGGDTERTLLEARLHTSGKAKERLHEGSRLLTEYHEAVETYQDVCERLTADTLDRLHYRLINRREQSNPTLNFRELYDLWVACSEEAYVELISCDEFSDSYARLVNSSLRLKRYTQSRVDELFSDLALPTRGDLDAAFSQIHFLRRELRNLQATSTVLHGRRSRARTSTKKREQPESGHRLVTKAALKKPSKDR